MSCPHVTDIALRPPTAAQQVHKDDCTQCFDTPDQPWGIDVCLSCFNGGCDSPDRNHSFQHYRLSQHPIVLNIKRKPKPKKVREESPAKILKLSIPGETEADNYDTTTIVKCLACDGLELDKAMPNVAEVVNGVLTALSSTKQSEVKAWEEEILPCEHTLVLDQDEAKVLADQELAHCSQCELKENLWLCLKCGNLGCGRQQFGGVGGNGHGLTHFEQTLHPVSVKLGSITPDGTADVYCYLCNEERQDPNLAEHLWHWGIKISERQKVEKSLVELQLEHNMKWEFSMTNESGAELQPLFGPGFTGLKNLGNSCYLASVVQCLFSLPTFQERYYYPNGDLPLTLDPANDLETQLRKLADGLLSGRYSLPPSREEQLESPYPKGIAPSMFKALVGKNHVEFSTMRQQDAFEFLLYMIQTIRRASHQTHDADPTKVFSFVSEQRLQCLGCKKVNYRTDLQDNISVPVPVERLPMESSQDNQDFQSVSLKECLDRFTQSERLEYTCQACGSKDGAVTRTAFKTFPEVLVVNARRFELVNWVPTKLDVPVVVPDEPFSLDDYFSTGLQPGEELLPQTPLTSDNEFVPNGGILSMLEEMGFPSTRCEKALYNTGNSDPDAAMNWLFQHMEDPDIDDPLNLGKADTNLQISEGSIAVLADMGFTVLQAKKALKETGGDMERAVEWLFSHPDDDGSTTEAQSERTEVTAGDALMPALFKLHSIICHKGASVHAGHYVTFIKKIIGEQPSDAANDSDWVLFNDEKVVRGGEVDEMKKFAYVYFFERYRG
ncbi:uncharacterized protein V1513DRAFT_434854 [Lipomyces chichibuensis]|uniref:uncharacterized protein n=1 Tax=Lipomyces chichibuensis TaxID=1546026 RepID=UPI0033442978